MMSIRFFSCKLLSCRFFFFNCRDCFHSWNFICFPIVFGKQMKVHFIWTIGHISVCQATTRNHPPAKKKKKKSSSWMIWFFNIWYYWFLSSSCPSSNPDWLIALPLHESPCESGFPLWISFTSNVKYKSFLGHVDVLCKPL